MARLVLEIPEDVTDSLRLPPLEMERELRKELSCGLYRRGALSRGKARKLAGMTRWEFEHLLGQRQVIRHYDERDLEEDIEYAKRG